MLIMSNAGFQQVCQKFSVTHNRLTKPMSVPPVWESVGFKLWFSRLRCTVCPLFARGLQPMITYDEKMQKLLS